MTLSQITHPAHVRLKYFLLPAAHVDAFLVHGQRGRQILHKIQRLRQIKHDARVVRRLLVLLCQERQVQLHGSTFKGVTIHDARMSITRMIGKRFMT